MKKHLVTVLAIALLSVCLAGCGWKPEVTAVPITAPWDKMNLPLKDNAIVWASSDNELKVVHKDNQKTVLKNYTEALKAGGWELVKFDEPTERYVVDMKKGAEQIEMEIYDFHNTGVIIKKTGGTSATTANPATKTTADTTVKTGGDSKVEKADLTMSALEYDISFTAKGVKKESLEKYANKNIAVSGRVSMLVPEKTGTVQPWVTLYAPGIGHGVSCYFDDDNVEQMKQLKMDKMAKVQGFQDDFLVPEVSPRLEHCVVLEAN